MVQRVSRAEVQVKNETVGKINRGYLVFLGVLENDGKKDADWLADKLLKLRVMSDENDKMNLNIKDAGGEILVVSQFTLAADTRKGNRPSFVKAAAPKEAKELYKYFVEKLKSGKIKIQTGKFGAYMKIKPTLDGPVTITLDSKEI